MEPRAKITNCTSIVINSDHNSVIYIVNVNTGSRDTAKQGNIRIEGGEISNCQVYGIDDSASLIEFEKKQKLCDVGSLYLAPGNVLLLSGNTDKNSDTFNGADFQYTDPVNRYDLSQYLTSGLSVPAN